VAIPHDRALGIAATGGGVSRYDVAVVEPDARNRMRLGTQLAGAAQFESIDELVQHLRPGRVVVAVFGPTLAVPYGFQQIQRITGAYPQLGAVLAVEEVTADVLQAAIRAGARDTVALNDAVALDQAVGRLGELMSGASASVPAVADTRPSPGRLIVVFSTKGGVGKSTLAINLGVVLARKTPERVAIVDADLQFGDVAVMLGLPPQHTVTDAAASLQFADPELMRNLLARHESGLYVLPAPTEATLGMSLPRAEIVGVCAALQAVCGYVVVDTATQFDDSVLGLVEAADEVLLVGSMDIPSVKNLKIGIQALDLAGIAGPKLRLVLNRANTQVKLDVREIEHVLGMRADFPIPSDIAVPIAVNAGIPVVVQEPKAAVTRAIEALATCLMVPDASADAGAKRRRGRKRARA
jgi:pilus assembly protein CpaE